MSLTITARGRATLATLVKRGDLWLAVGTGAANWPVPQPPAVQDASVGLVNPIGLVRLVAADFVQPVTTGEAFSTDDGSKWAYAAANVATAHLCLDFRLGPTDLMEADTVSGLREWQLLIDPTFARAIPPGQRVVPVADVTGFGLPLAIEHTVPMYRAGVDEVRRYVITP
jgi:hypothetical protein